MADVGLCVLWKGEPGSNKAEDRAEGAPSEAVKEQSVALPAGTQMQGEGGHQKRPLTAPVCCSPR